MNSFISRSVQVHRRMLSIALLLGMSLCAGRVTLSLAQDAPSAFTHPAKLQQLFVEAGTLYDKGQFAEAIRQYAGLIDDGYAGKELYFNMANACFKDGRSGPAVLNYRRAWYESPRDPDIRANLQFAIRSAGASGPSLPSYMKPFLALNRESWVHLATVFYWTASALAAILLVRRAHRDILLRLTGLLVACLVLSLGGIAVWVALCRHPEIVITAGRQEALFAPIEGSTAHFALPEGSIVRERERSGPWIKVSDGKREGWIRADTSAPVCALNNEPESRILPLHTTSERL